jgi:hypothetical protein
MVFNYLVTERYGARGADVIFEYLTIVTIE